MARLPVNSVLIAHKAIGLAPGLSGDTRRVATAILDHFNHKTGRCDPSIGRLATLLGIGERTVRKATQQLCNGDERLFDKKSHGGHAHCASYAPCWQTFHALVDAWNASMQTSGNVDPNRNERAGSTGTNVPVEPAQTCLQTRRRNQTKEPVEVSPSAPDCGKPPPYEQRQGRKGLRKNGAEPNRQRYLMHAIAGGKGPSRKDAVEGAYWRRISEEIAALPEHKRAAAWEAAQAATGT